MRKLVAGFGPMLGVALAFAAAGAVRAQDAGGGDYGSSAGDEELGSHIKSSNQNITRPVSRSKFDASVAKLFRQADTNNDGIITLAEFNAIITARKEEVIAERFARVDTNHDKSISSAEFFAWQHGLGSAALIDESSAGSEMVAEQLGYSPGRSDSEIDMAQMIEPITATALVEANTDYDAGVSLAEFTAWEAKRFEAADGNHDGWVEVDEMRLFLSKDQAAAGPPPGRPPGRRP